MARTRAGVTGERPIASMRSVTSPGTGTSAITVFTGSRLSASAFAFASPALCVSRQSYAASVIAQRTTQGDAM